MRSFRLYRPTPVVVQKRVEDYTSEEARQLLENFKPIAEKYRTRSMFALGSFLTGIFSVVLISTIFPHSEEATIWIFIILLPSMTAFVVLLMSLPKLICPGCGNSAKIILGPYCPECGEHSLELRGIFSAPYCSRSRKYLKSGKRQNYKIHHCNHCGVFLDSKGL